jgi:hypothetical protein
MDGNSNSATLVDHRPVSRRNEWNRHTPFRDQADVDGLDCAWWDEPRDASHKVHSPLSLAGFVRLGELNRSTSTARSNPNRRGYSHRVDVDVLPPTHVQPSFRPAESAVGVSCRDGHAAGSVASSEAPAESMGANIPPQNDTPFTTPGAGGNVISGVIEEDSAPELNDAVSAGPLPAAAKQSPFHQLQDLSKRVKLGDESAIAEIQRILNSNDALWRHLGDVEKTTEATLIEFAEGTAASKESVRRSVAAMKQSLLGEQPTPLERMAVGRVVACWMIHALCRRMVRLVRKAGRACERRGQAARSERKALSDFASIAPAGSADLIANRRFSCAYPSPNRK